MLGLAPDEVVGTYCPKAVHGLDHPYAGCPLEEAGGRPITVEREFFEEKFGVWVNSAVYPTARKIGGKTVYAHTVQPITARKRAELALRDRLAVETMIGEVTTRLLRAPPEELLAEVDRAVATTAQFMACDSCTFYLADGDVLTEAVSWAMEGRPRLLPHQLPAAVLPARAMEPRHTLRASLGSVLDVAILARTAVVPVILDGAPAGVGLFLCAEPTNPWLPDQRWLELLGSTFSAVWQREREIEREQRYAAELRSMAMELASAEARERRQLADDLHDGIGQSLALANMLLTRLRSQPASAPRLVAEASTQIEDAIVGAKALMFDLCPPSLHELGIVGAIDALLEQAGPRFELAWELVHDGSDLPLSEDHRAFVYRAVRELLGNVHKHAHATRVRVALARVGHDLVLEVADDGNGMPVAAPMRGKRPAGFGLFSLEERLRHIGGRLGTRSPPGGGAWVTITLPLDEPAAGGAAP
jgi:signal transduction histidine kinase